MEHENTPLAREKTIFQTIIFRFKLLTFLGVFLLVGSFFSEVATLGMSVRFGFDIIREVFESIA